jgi:hypothetical protein
MTGSQSTVPTPDILVEDEELDSFTMAGKRDCVKKPIFPKENLKKTKLETS